MPAFGNSRWDKKRQDVGTLSASQIAIVIAPNEGVRSTSEQIALHEQAKKAAPSVAPSATTGPKISVDLKAGTIKVGPYTISYSDLLATIARAIEEEPTKTGKTVSVSLGNLSLTESEAASLKITIARAGVTLAKLVYRRLRMNGDLSQK